ncbi:MAG: NADH-quinone oxidoreductase subunit N, partial [Myxococcales bacterium]
MDAAASVRALNVASLSSVSPELVLAAGAVAIPLVGVALGRRRGACGTTAAFGAAVLALAAFATLIQAGHAPRALFGGLLVDDGVSLLFRWIFLGAGLLTLTLAARSPQVPDSRFGEFLGLTLAMLAGMGLMAASANLLLAWLSVELVSLCSYALSGFRGRDRASAEAALKFVVYGGVASGVMLFGITYLFGLTGSLSLPHIGAALAGSESRAVVLVALVFVLAGLGYKLAAAPWHMWAPDVYEGAPTPFTALLSVASKAAAFALALRLLHPMFGAPALPLAGLLGLVAATSMTFGNLAALGQTNLKRLLAYSSVAHAGYLLVGLATGTRAGQVAVLLGLGVYALMNFGAFAVVEAVGRAAGGEDVGRFRGLGRRAPFTAVSFAVFLFSLTGLPPLAGFVAK